MNNVEALVEKLKIYAVQSIAKSATLHSEFGKGLMEGGGLAYELAAKLLEQAIAEDANVPAAQSNS